MENSEIVVGLDIGTTKIVAMVGRRNEFGKVEILGVGKSDSIGVSHGVVSNIINTVDSIKRAVAEAEKQSGVEINVVNVGIAGQHIKSIQHRGIYTRKNTQNEIDQEDIDALNEDMYRLAMPPGEQIIHVLPQEYFVDSASQTTNPIGMMGSRLEANFHIITGNVSAAQNIYRCCQNAGLQVNDMILEPLASARAVLSKEEEEAGVVLVDIGGGTTDIAIFHDCTIRHTAVIPFGGNVITDDIKKECGIIKNYAELLKVRHGSALALDNMNKIITIPGLKGRPAKEISMKFLANIIQARMEEIMECVFYEIKSSGYKDHLSAGIVLTGGGALLKHVGQFTEYITAMETRIGLPNEHTTGNIGTQINSPIYSTSIGLMLKGFSETPKEQKEKEEKRKEHSKIKRGNFFEKLLNKGREFFDDEDIQ
ncbi:MAG: cell division protein FtsA [Flavobacteriales bacterium]|nr:cell division protein FtsA [Flavobacteriales bacterium]MCZ2444122.1 cell division protein FtsA [Flavobacteriales bacterium]